MAAETAARTDWPHIEVDPETGEVTAYDDERRVMAIGPDEATARAGFAALVEESA
jgi:hypothetical protein